MKKMLVIAIVAMAASVAQAGVVVQPVGLEWDDADGAFTVQRWSNRVYNGAGLSDASIVETGDLVPDVWPTHVMTGNFGGDFELSFYDVACRLDGSSGTPQQATLTFDLGGTYEIDGVALWNYNEYWNSWKNGRGLGVCVVEYSTDGTTWMTGETVTFSESPQDDSAQFAPEVISFSNAVTANYIRLNATSTGANNQMGLCEIRFTAVPEPATMALLGLGGFVALKRRK